METTTQTSVAQRGSELRRVLSRIDASTRQIAKLKEYAISAPESRGAIVSALEEYTERYRGTRRATAACRAVTTILTVGMLEILQER